MESDMAEPAKQLLPYLQRADELQKHEPLVAYYCRLHAMERGLRIPQKERTKTTNAILVSLMNQLEKDKKSLKLSPDDYLYVEGFASKIFAKADKQDRAGQATLETAKTFYAASIFFDILNQFGELQPDIEQKQKYAIWKAADIRKAIKEGRRPEPGPPGGEKDQLQPDLSSSSTSIHDPVQSERFSSQPDDNLPASYQPQDLGRSESLSYGSPADDTSSRNNDNLNLHGSGHLPTTPPYSRTDYPGNEFYQPPPSDRPEYSSYHQQYDHTNFQNELQPTSQNYLPPGNPSTSYSYPNFQSYPSFNDSVFPAAPAHQPTYYQSPDTSYSHQPSPASQYTPTVQYGSNGGSDGNHVPAASSLAENYKYDSNYQPPVEKIAEAHKAARFAVGALAFDDVATAVDFLKKSLELLTNPSAEAH